MIRKCRKAMFRWKIADSSDQSLTGGQLLMRSLILRRLLLREVFAADEKYVGVLLPPSVPARGGQRRRRRSPAAWPAISTTPSRPT